LIAYCSKIPRRHRQRNLRAAARQQGHTAAARQQGQTLTTSFAQRRIKLIKQRHRILLWQQVAYRDPSDFALGNFHWYFIA
jgi:hypothetical protein